MKSVQVRSFFWPVFSRIRIELRRDTPYLCVFSPNGYGPDKTPYLDTFQAVMDEYNQDIFSQNQNTFSVLKKEQIGDMGF